MRFEKWQALGNDYVVLESEELALDPAPAVVRAICEPHFGCHSDGVLLLSRPADDSHVAELRIFNPDGSEAELSGNGAREAVLYLRRAGWTDRDSFTVLTAAGEIRPTLQGADAASIEMGRARTESTAFPGGPADGRATVQVAGVERELQHVSIGNPQCAIEIPEPGALEQLDLGVVGPPIESDERFPERTNVSFWRRQGGAVRARIFERGVGETLSSGTGASGAAIAAYLRGAASPVRVVLDGGELEVEIGPDLAVTLTGTAEPVFAGRFSEEFVRRLRGLARGR